MLQNSEVCGVEVIEGDEDELVSVEERSVSNDEELCGVVKEQF